MKKIRYTLFLTLLAVVFSSCHNILKEETLIIEGIDLGALNYKYSYKISAFPTYQVLYSNTVYNIGDTLRYCGEQHTK
jgi:hypothetical protein